VRGTGDAGVGVGGERAVVQAACRGATTVKGETKDVHGGADVGKKT